MAKRGPKSQYKPEYCELIEQWRGKGLTPRQIARNLGISYPTIWKWLRLFPEFREAYERGRVEARCEVENALFRLATGYTVEEETVDKRSGPKGPVTVEKTTIKHYAPNVAAIIFYLTNDDPEHWKNTQALRHSTEDSFKVDLTLKEAKEKLKQMPADELKHLQKTLKGLGEFAGRITPKDDKSNN